MVLMCHTFISLMVWCSAVRFHNYDIAQPLEEGEGSWAWAPPVSWLARAIEVASVMIVIVLFTTLLTIARWMSNPIGNDETDYDLDFDLKGLLDETREVLASMSNGAEEDDVADEMVRSAQSDEPFARAGARASASRSGGKRLGAAGPQKKPEEWSHSRGRHSLL